MEQSISTGLEPGNEDDKQKADYQEDGIFYTRSGQPKKRVSVLSDDRVQEVMYNTEIDA